MAITSNLAVEINEKELSDGQAVATDNIVRLDLSRFDRRETVRQARRLEREESAKPEAVKMPKRFSLSAVLYGLAFTALALILLFSYLEVTVLTDQVADKRAELAELQSRESILRTEYDKRLDLNSIEEYAVNNLNMVKVERSQLEYIEIKAPESIQMISPNENEKLSYYIANLTKSFNAVLKNID